MSYLDQIDKERLPKHIAIIMDGNGRWAKQRNLDRTFGHREGISAVRKVIEAASEAHISYLTLYTFSTENWNRPVEEIDALMALMVQAVVRELPDLLKNNVKINVIGDINRLPKETKDALEDCIKKTSVSTGVTATLALSYSSKWELTEAMKIIATEVKSGNINIEDINEDLITSHLSTKDIPNPDILIRTGGELRISNFLLWQIAYSELFFSDQLWPDFDKESLYSAIVNFQNRERRFGKTSEQVSSK